MTTKRQLDAYRRRLARITESMRPDGLLTLQCLGAVVQVAQHVGGERITYTGTLVAFTHRQAPGLFGMQAVTDVRLCTACIGQVGDCSRDTEIDLEDIWLDAIVRNDDDAIARLQAAVS